MRLKYLLLLGVAALVSGSAIGADYRLEALDEAPPSDALSDDITSQIAETGMRVIRGSKTKYCDVWLCKQWPLVAGFEPTPEVMYPFKPGQLVGVARFDRRGSDFRDQDISSGVYTLRYGQQPVDGSHIGTSPTRDFLLLVRAEDDANFAPKDPEELNLQSAEAAESTHPCLLALQRSAGAKAPFPSMRHDVEFDWWIIDVKGSTKAGDGAGDLTLSLVIAGQAIE